MELDAYLPIHFGWRCGVRDAQERFDGFEEFVALQRQYQALQPAIAGLNDSLAEPGVLVQIHRGTVEMPHQQEVDDTEVLELDEHFRPVRNASVSGNELSSVGLCPNVG